MIAKPTDQPSANRATQDERHHARDRGNDEPRHMSNVLAARDGVDVLHDANVPVELLDDDGRFVHLEQAFTLHPTERRSRFIRLVRIVEREGDKPVLDGWGAHETTSISLWRVPSRTAFIGVPSQCDG